MGKKIGEGHATAMFRAGFKELAQVLPAFPEGIRPVEEQGLAGNPTPQIVTEQMGNSTSQDQAPETDYQRVLAQAASRGNEQSRSNELER